MFFSFESVNDLFRTARPCVSQLESGLAEILNPFPEINVVTMTNVGRVAEKAGDCRGQRDGIHSPSLIGLLGSQRPHGIEIRGAAGRPEARQ
jgi:hypothetical protein